MKVRYRASLAVTSINCTEFPKTLTYNEKSALLKFGVFQQNRQKADLRMGLLRSFINGQIMHYFSVKMPEKD